MAEKSVFEKLTEHINAIQTGLVSAKKTTTTWGVVSEKLHESWAESVKGFNNLSKIGLVAAADTVRVSYVYNQALIDTNASIIQRNVLLQTGLQAQIATGAAAGESAEAMKALAGWGMKSSGELKSNLTTVLMMHKGLGVSVSSAAELAAVSKALGVNFKMAGDVVAGLAQNTALTADEATRMANELGRALRAYSGTGGKGQFAGMSNELGAFQAAMKEATGSTSEGLNRFYKAVISGQNSLNLIYGKATIQGGDTMEIMTRLSREVEKTLPLRETNVVAFRAQMEMLSQVYTDSTLSVEDLSAITVEYVEKQRMLEKQAKLNNSLTEAFTKQMSQSGEAFMRFINTAQAFVQLAMTPAALAFNLLASGMNTVMEVVRGLLSAWDGFKYALMGFGAFLTYKVVVSFATTASTIWNSIKKIPAAALQAAASLDSLAISMQRMSVAGGGGVPGTASAVAASAAGKSRWSKGGAGWQSIGVTSAALVATEAVSAATSSSAAAAAKVAATETAAAQTGFFSGTMGGIVSTIASLFAFEVFAKGIGSLWAKLAGKLSAGGMKALLARGASYFSFMEGGISKIALSATRLAGPLGIGMLALGGMFKVWEYFAGSTQEGLNKALAGSAQARNVETALVDQLLKNDAIREGYTDKLVTKMADSLANMQDRRGVFEKSGDWINSWFNKTTHEELTGERKKDFLSHFQNVVKLVGSAKDGEIVRIMSMVETAMRRKQLSYGDISPILSAARENLAQNLMLARTAERTLPEVEHTEGSDTSQQILETLKSIRELNDAGLRYSKDTEGKKETRANRVEHTNDMATVHGEAKQAAQVQ